MERKWRERGVPAPLFDRLSDFEPTVLEESPPFVNYNEAEVKASVQQECTRVLNTRCKLTKAEYEKLEPIAGKYRFPAFFGLPDGTIINPKNPNHAARMERMMAKAIEIFEPRLQNVHVAMSNYEESTQSMALSVAGDLVIGEVSTPITFPIALEDFQDQGDREKVAYDTRPKIELNKE